MRRLEFNSQFAMCNSDRDQLSPVRGEPAHRIGHAHGHGLRRDAATCHLPGAWRAVLAGMVLASPEGRRRAPPRGGVVVILYGGNGD